jgi:Mg-chelatase subunit ChlD
MTERTAATVAVHALLTLCLAGAALAQRDGRSLPQNPAQNPPPTPALGEAATNTLVHAFESADSWSMKAIVLLSLGNDWHPVGGKAVLAALTDKDARLRAFGIEALRRTTPQALASIATPELVEELVERTSKTKNEFVQKRVMEVLTRMLPTAGAKDRAAWQAWWSANAKTHVPAPWSTPDRTERGPGTVAGTIVERAFDLRDDGLEVAIVIDSTGSMQLAIDAARDAVDEIVAMLSGIAPKLRLGLVHYKDLGDMGGGAALLVPLTKDQKRVRERLGKLIASGGGDIPESVDRGIEVALEREMGWTRGANRMLLVIGDAPPHPAKHAALLETVKRAYEAPFSGGRGPVTGAKSKLKPFITSAIATNRQAKATFDEIAAAGGGASVVLDVQNASQGGPGTAVEQLVEHVLALSFGSQYQGQMKLFARTFFEYRTAGAF